MNSLSLIWKEIRIPAFLLAFTLFGGACGYKILYPDIPWSKLIYFTAITLSTVGYGDTLNVEQDPAATFYTIVLIFLGMGMVLYSASSITAFIIEGHLGNLFKKRAMMKKIESMENHFIVCGAGETGLHVIKEIIHSGRDLVVIDGNEDKLKNLTTTYPQLATLSGDATIDDCLKQARVENAQGLIATLSGDKDNLFLTFTAKMLNNKLQIVAKTTNLTMIKKLENAGADYVVSPQFIGGMRIASVMLRPNVVSFLDRMLKGKDKSIRVNEFVIPETSSLNGLTFEEAPIREKTGINVFAYCPTGHSGEFSYNPAPNQALKAGGVLLYIATSEQQSRMEKAFS